MSKFQKNAPRKLYTFVFPSELADQEAELLKENAQKVIQEVSLLRDNFKWNVYKQTGVELTDEAAIENFVKNAGPDSIYAGYTLSNYNHNLLKGVTVFYFEEITQLDLNFLSNLLPQVMPLMKMDETNLVGFLGNEQNIKQVQDIVKELFHKKLSHVQYDSSVPKEEQLSKEEVIEMIFEKQGFTVEDMKQFKNFVQKVLSNSIVKKKSLGSIAG